MTHTEKVNNMYQLLKNASTPLTKDEICRFLDGCDRSTFYRVKSEIFSESNQEVLTDKSSKPYRYFLEPADSRAKAIPNILLKDREIEALVIIEQVAHSLDSGYLKNVVTAFQKAIDDKIEKQGILLDNWRNRVKVIPIARAPIYQNVFRFSATSVLRRKRLKIRYQSLSDSSSSTRTISPQTLLQYRDNWYLDAYCHASNDMRTFRLSRITEIKLLPDRADSISDEELTSRYSTSYGIFSGRAKYIAKIKFIGVAAKIVRKERWHPEQLCEVDGDRSTTLSIPYDRDEELLMDILKWGDMAELLEPQELRDKIYQKIKKMNIIYECRKN